MAKRIKRRDFMTTTAAAGMAAAVRPLSASGPTVLLQGNSRPVIVASANGHQFKNGGAQTCVELAFERCGAERAIFERDALRLQVCAAAVRRDDRRRIAEAEKARSARTRRGRGDDRVRVVLAQCGASLPCDVQRVPGHVDLRRRHVLRLSADNIKRADEGRCRWRRDGGSCARYAWWRRPDAGHLDFVRLNNGRGLS